MTTASFSGGVISFDGTDPVTAQEVEENGVKVSLKNVQVTDIGVKLTIDIESGTTITIDSCTFEQSCTIGSSLTNCNFANDTLSMTKDNTINFNGFVMGIVKGGSSITFRNDGVTISGSVSNHGFKYNQLSFNYQSPSDSDEIVNLENPLVLTIYGDSTKERKYTISKLEGNLYVNSDRNSKLIENKVVFQPLKSLLLPPSVTLGTEFPSRSGDIVIVAEDSEVSVDKNSVQKLEKGLLLSSYYNSETQETTQAMFFAGNVLPSA